MASVTIPPVPRSGIGVNYAVPPGTRGFPYDILTGTAYSDPYNPSPYKNVYDFPNAGNTEAPSGGYQNVAPFYLTNQPGPFKFDASQVVPWQFYQGAGSLLNDVNARAYNEFNPFSSNVYGNNPAKRRTLETLIALEGMHGRKNVPTFGAEKASRLPSPFTTMAPRVLGALAQQEPARINALLQTLMKNYTQSAGLLASRQQLESANKMGRDERKAKQRQQLKEAIPIIGGLVAEIAS